MKMYGHRSAEQFFCKHMSLLLQTFSAKKGKYFAVSGTWLQRISDDLFRITHETTVYNTLLKDTDYSRFTSLLHIRTTLQQGGNLYHCDTITILRDVVEKNIVCHSIPRGVPAAFING